MTRRRIKRSGAAKILGVSPWMVRNYPLHPTRTAGGWRLYDRDEVLAFATRRTARLRARLRAAKRGLRAAAAA